MNYVLPNFVSLKSLQKSVFKNLRWSIITVLSCCSIVRRAEPACDKYDDWQRKQKKEKIPGKPSHSKSRELQVVQLINNRSSFDCRRFHKNSRRDNAKITNGHI